MRNSQPLPLRDRDRAVVAQVARFKQLTSSQIRELVFGNTASHTPCSRSLARLVEQQYLMRIERRVPGGSRGGSGQYVYQLGRRGYYVHFTGRYDPARSVNFHTLAIADAFLVMRRLHVAGRFEILGYASEPDCWMDVGGVTLKPDFRMDVRLPDRQLVKMWFEVDMGTEQQRQLKGKLEAYWRAYNDADVNVLPVFPRTVWIAIDDERVTELRWLIDNGPAEARALFEVCTLDTLPSLF